HLRFERGRPFIPEEPAAPVEPRVGQRHGATCGMFSVQSAAEARRVTEAALLSMTRRAGDSVVRGQAHVVEEHAPECRTCIRYRVVRGSIVGAQNRAGSGKKEMLR